MAIDKGQKTVDLISQLVELNFRRNLVTNELAVEFTYATGYIDADGAFVEHDRNVTSFGPEASLWALQRKPSHGNLTDPTLAKFLTVLFDALEEGVITPPAPTPPEPEPTP